MSRTYNIYQINSFLFDTKVFHLSVNSYSCPLQIHLYYDHQLMFGITSDHPLYQELLRQKTVCITAYRTDGKWLYIHGTICLEKDEKYANLAKKRAPGLTRHCNELTHIELKMFHFEQAEAYIIDQFHHTNKADLH